MPAALLALLAVASVLTPVGPAAAQTGASGAGKPADQKLSLDLANVAAAATGRPGSNGPSAPSGPWAPAADNQPGGLRRVRAGEVVVDVHGEDVSDALQARLTAAGGHVLAVSDPAFRTITLSVPDADLDAVASVPGVHYVEDVVTPTLQAACAPLVSEGDTQLQAALARSDFGVDGTGVKVGILSDSFDKDASAPTHAAGDVAAGELPGASNPCGRTTPVSLVDDSSPSDNIDEGRAMAQIVHDLAPGASLAFATATVSTTSFANNITNLRNAGANVIVDDVNWSDEPIYQDGPIAVSITNARNAGVTYVTAAGNRNITVGGKEVGSYESLAWRATSCPSGLPFTYLDCYNFNPSGGADNKFRVSIAPGGDLSINLQWAQPWNGVNTDLDLCFVPTTGSPQCGVANNLSSQKPLEVKTVTNTSSSAQTMDIVIGRYAGPAPSRFKMIHQNSALTSVEYSTTTATDIFGPTVGGHAGAPAAISAAAVRYNNSTAPESFSSRGPVTQLFQPVPSTTALPSPVVVAKPDVAATDGGINSFFGTSSPPYRFYGTSAAGPHVAAVAALLLQAKPTLIPTQLASILQSTAAPVGAYPATAVGGGLVNADAALRAAAGAAPAITSANAATFTAGQPGTFTVTATGAPAPAVGESGALPSGVTFNPATKTLSGTPAAGTVGSYPITFTASNGVSPDANQPFTLTVQAGVPAVHGAAFYADGTTAKSGASGTVITAYGFGLRANTAYRLMTSPVQGDPSLRCTINLAAVNTNVRTANAHGFVGSTTGPVSRPAGTYDVCFVAQDNSTLSAGPTFQVA